MFGIGARFCPDRHQAFPIPVVVHTPCVPTSPHLERRCVLDNASSADTKKISPYRHQHIHDTFRTTRPTATMCFGAFTEEAENNPNRRPLYFGDPHLEYVKKRSSYTTTSDGRPRRASSVYVASSRPRTASYSSKSKSYSSTRSSRTPSSPVSPRPPSGWSKSTRS